MGDHRSSLDIVLKFIYVLPQVRQGSNGLTGVAGFDVLCGLPGEGQENVVKGRLAKRQVRELDVRGVQFSYNCAQYRRAVSDHDGYTPYLVFGLWVLTPGPPDNLDGVVYL